MLTGMKFSGIQTEVAFRPVFQYPDRSGIQASFPVSRPKWHSGQCSGIQTEVAFRPVFRYPDRSGIQASVPVSRPKWHSSQFSGIQTEVAFRPVFRYPDRSGIQASVPVSRPKWHSGQFSGIQIEVAFRPVFRYPDRSGIQASVPFNIPCRYSDGLSPYQTDSSFKTTSLPILTGIVTSLHFSANFWAFVIFNPLIPRKSFSISYHIASCQSELAPRSSDIIQDTLWVLLRRSVNTRKILEVLPTGPDGAYSPCKSPGWMKQESAAELSCSLGEQMLRLAKSTAMLARRAGPSLGEGCALQKISERFWA
ncbi:hypothetical protein KIW84_042619 [Lathyrus oleraceus]|uniref:Uncharacterized protein n=1 Tax=Pisum sativum TaxID=3888 RepID=A0A9D5ATA1_PEA|nr:hypothetical protein KIW84_042619 [Pisum sativum]